MDHADCSTQLLGRLPLNDETPGMRPIVIVGVGPKVAYVIVVVVAIYLFGWLLLPTNRAVQDVVGDAVLLVGWIFGVRSFRGKDENTAVPRSWWRVTARPPFGFIAGGVFLTLAGLSALSIATGRAEATHAVRVDLSALPVYLFFGVAYLHSSVRLVRRPDPAKAQMVR